MGNVERWDVFICPSCGTLYPDLSTLCECELPNNIDGVETKRVTVVPASQLRGAVEVLRDVRSLAANQHIGASHACREVVRACDAALGRLGGQ